MKNIFTILFCVQLLFVTDSFSQFPLDAKTSNRSVQPTWGPVGYHYVSFYYLPELDIYYDVNQKLFVYSNGTKWEYAQSLPKKYQTYNLYSTYKVVFQDDNIQPFTENKKHQRAYKQYRKDNSQVPIIATKDPRY